MAEKRMFNRTVVQSDAFLDQSASAQTLYFQLGMVADDDGFLNSPKKEVRSFNRTMDDLRELIQNRFLLEFPSGIIVIKHWRINNYIPKDRYKPTVYTDEMAMITIKENGSYTFKHEENDEQCDDSEPLEDEGSEDVDALDTECIQGDDEMTSQIRLDKIRLEENRGDEEVVSDETPSAPPEPPEPPSSPKRKQRVKAEDPFIVFASTDADLLKALDDFEEMRKTVKRPLTYRAKTDLIGDLNRMSQDRNIWIASLSRSIKNCWLGVFYPKDDGKVEGVGDEEKRRRREITQKENEEIEAKIEREKEERLRKFRENGGVIAGPFGAPVFTPKKIED